MDVIYAYDGCSLNEMAVSDLDQLPFFHLSDDDFLNIYDMTKSKLSDFVTDNDLMSYIGRMRQNDDFKELQFDYYTEDHFNSKVRGISKECVDISLFHLNIRSLNANHRGLCQYLEMLSLDFDVIVLSEIWSNNVDYYHSILPGYTFYFELPKDTNVGGIGMYIINTFIHNEQVQYKIVPNNLVKMENIWIEVTKNKTKYIIGGIYRHPNTSIVEYTKALDSSLNKISNQQCPCLIAGDVNIDLTKCRVNRQTADYVNTLLLHNFLPTVIMPTRITTKSATLIDHIYYYEGKNNMKNIQTKSGNLLNDLTDHLPNYTILMSKQNKAIKERPLIRLFTEANKNKFASDIKNSDWNVLYNQTEVNAAFNIFSSTIQQLFEKKFQLVKLSRKKAKDKIWVTTGLKISSIHKNKLYKRWILSQNYEDECNYKKYKKTYSKVAARAQEMYYKQMFDSKTNTIKKLWENLNTVCSFKRKPSKNSVSKLIINDQVLVDSYNISNGFNKYFSSVGETLVQNLTNDPMFNNLSFTSYLDKPRLHSMFCEPLEAEELFKLIENLNTHKSPGPDGIAPKLIKEIAPLILQPLLYLFNLSLSTGTFPDTLKLAKVIPIYKKGERHLPSNYRPISLLSIFSKLLEKVMHKRLYSYLQGNNILYRYQFGFRKNHSTALALIDVVDSMYRHLDNNETVIGLYLDLQKAFDTVNHKILLQKLNNYGIRGIVLDWFKSYLSRRNQFTTVNTCNSEILSINCGVPQGSVLGPLLFLIYVNDIRNAAPEAKIKLFADDTNVFIHGRDKDHVVLQANKCINKLNYWFLANRLSINIDKTYYTVFGSGRADKDIKINLSGTNIQRVTSCKYLGVLIDEELKWVENIEYIYNKLIKYIGIFYKLQNILPATVLRNIYFAFVHPHLLYAIEIYGNAATSQLDKLLKLNNKLLRILQKRDMYTKIKELYNTYNTLPIIQLHEMQILVFVHKILYHKETLPEIFTNYFIPNNLIHEYSTRNQNMLHLYSISSTYGRRAIQFKGGILWNSLPSSLQSQMSLRSFKIKIKQYLSSVWIT